MIIIKDHTILNNEILDKIKSMKSINPYLRNFKVLDIDYSDLVWWDEVDELEAFTQNDDRYSEDHPIINRDGRIEVSVLESLIRDRLKYKLNEWWIILTNHPLVQPIRYLEPKNGKTYKNNSDRKYHINGEEIVVKGADRVSFDDMVKHKWDSIFGMYVVNKGIVVSTYNLTDEQVLKVIEHEASHIMIRNHCEYPTCLMKNLYDTGDIDLANGFCEDCNKIINNYLL